MYIFDLLWQLCSMYISDGVYESPDEHVVWSADFTLQVQATSIQAICIVLSKLRLVTQQLLEEQHIGHLQYVK